MKNIDKGFYELQKKLEDKKTEIKFEFEKWVIFSGKKSYKYICILKNYKIPKITLTPNGNQYLYYSHIIIYSIFTMYIYRRYKKEE